MNDNFDDDFQHDSRKTFALALQMMSEDEFGEAVRLLDQVIEQEPTLADAYAFRGSAKYFLDHLPEAQEDCETALALDPNCFEALTLRGRISFDSRKYHTALNALNQALEIAPDNLYAHSLLARVHLETAYYDEAIAEFDFMLQEDPDLSFALANRAWAYSHVGRIDEAFADNDRLLEMDPFDVNVIFQRGIFLFTMQRYEEALVYFEKTFKQEAPSQAALAQLFDHTGWTLLFLDRWDESSHNFEKSLELATNHDRAWVRTLYGYAVVLGRLGRVDESKSKLHEILEAARKLNLTEYDFFLQETLKDFDAEKAAKLPPFNDLFARVMNLHAMEKTAKEQYDEALELINRGIEAAPLLEWSYDTRARIYLFLEKYEELLQDTETLLRLCNDHGNQYKLGLALSRVGRFDEAFEVFTKVLEENIDAETFYELAKIHRIREEDEKVLETLTRAIDIGEKEDLDRYLQTRARLYGRLKQYDKALDDFARILYFQPDHIGALHFRSILYCNDLNRYEEAIRDETRILQINPEFHEAYTVRGTAWGQLAMEIEAAQEEAEASEFEREEFEREEFEKNEFETEPTELENKSQLYPRPIEWPQVAELLQSQDFYDPQECWDHAFADLEKSLQIAPGDLQTHWELGLFHYKKDNLERAKKEFQFILNEMPDDFSAWYWYARICCNQGLNEEVVQSVDAALKRARELEQESGPESVPDLEAFHTVKGQALRQMFRFTEAAKEFERVLEMNPDHIYVRTFLADIKRNLGAFEEAIDLADMILEDHPDFPFAYFTKVEALICSGRQDEAFQLLLQSTMDVPNQARAFAMLGELYEVLQDSSLAKEHYEKAVQSTPSDWDPESINMLYRGIALAGLGDHEAAIPCFIDSLSEQERVAPCNESDYRLARSYFALKQYEKAKEHAVRAMQYLNRGRDWPSRIQICQKLLNDLQ